ncbi:MAG: rod shape-determining protein MreC [Deltaproteobacteria bacterium]
MRNILIFLTKYSPLFVFIVLELIALNLIINYNNRQKEIFLYSSNLVSAFMLKEYNKYLDYFKLADINKRLKDENALLFENYYNQKYREIPRYENSDSIVQIYSVIPAGVCNKSIDKRNNRITIDRGSSAGIQKGMGVIDAKGIIGVVNMVNENFSSIIPLNNTVSRTSVAVKNKEYFGILKWEPYDYRYCTLTTIPKHANIKVGDSIITSGFSTIYPKGIYLGKIEKIGQEQGTTYLNIRVRLVNDLALTRDVYIIDNKEKIERQKIESQ